MTTPTVLHGPEYAGVPAPGIGFMAARWGQKHPPADPNVTFAGKTVLVTGANVGLGFESAVKFAQKGCEKLILAVRSQQKGEEAKTEIVRRSGISATQIVIVLVDLGRFDDVKRFVKNLENATEYLDIALLNAGLANLKFITSENGWEMALQVNVLSTALMAVLLLPLLRRTAAANRFDEPPHLTFTNSIGHTEAKREWYDTSLLSAANDKNTWDLTKSYMILKLLGMAVMKRLSQACNSASGKPEIIVNACCPFMTDTNLGRNMPWLYKQLFAMRKYFTARTAEEGARTLVGATALGEESMGRFWFCDVLYPSGDLVSNEEVMKGYWEEIEKVIEGVEPDVRKILQG